MKMAADTACSTFFSRLLRNSFEIRASGMKKDTGKDPVPGKENNSDLSMTKQREYPEWHPIGSAAFAGDPEERARRGIA